MGVSNFPKVVAWRCTGRESNPGPLDLEPDTLTITPPLYCIDSCRNRRNLARETQRNKFRATLHVHEVSANDEDHATLSRLFAIATLHRTWHCTLSPTCSFYLLTYLPCDI